MKAEVKKNLAGKCKEPGQWQRLSWAGKCIKVIVNQEGDNKCIVWDKYNMYCDPHRF